MNTFLKRVETSFENNANPEIAGKQSAYLKNHFQFYGIQNPQRKLLLKSPLKDLSISNEAELINILDRLWQNEHRECQYTACDIAEKYLSLASDKAMVFFETMIRTKSWWDTVDKIASNLIGPTLSKYPQSKLIMNDWIHDENMWIRRSALLFQLRYKHATDERLLFEYCRLTMHEKEFFIQKAIGWALREYSKTSPKSVSRFIDQNRSNLSGLSIREGLRVIEKSLENAS